MTTKEQEFKSRLVAVLSDLQENGGHDGEAMWLLGSLASDLADDFHSRDWSSAKRTMSPQTYDALLRTFQDQGNEHHREGRTKHAYAIQALAVSLIAHSQRQDADIAQGAALLDEIIDRTVILYRRDKAGRAN